MQRIAIIVIFLIFMLNQVLAYEFEHFQLKGELKTINKLSSKSRYKQKSQKLSFAKRDLARKLLNLDEVTNLGMKEDNPNENYSLIFKKVKELLGNNINQLGDTETTPLVLNHQMGGGVQNFSGFSWHRPQSNFLLHAHREVTPDLMSERWIVHDTLVITVDASTLLTNMKDLDLLEITDETIALYAGMGVQRTYHFYHYANDYIEGLTSDYRKLFLSFDYFKPEKVLQLSPYEILKRDDQFYLNVGGIVNTPPYYGVNFKGGVIANKNYQNQLTIQMLGPNDSKEPSEFLRISVDKEHSLGADINMRLQIDFFNLLKLSILSFDLNYDYAESKKTHFSFYKKDQLIDGYKYNSFKKLLNGQDKSISNLDENIVQNDERLSQNLSSKYSILLLGKIKKTNTEQIKVLKDNEFRYFYKNYSSSVKIVQNLWSRLFSTFVFKLFDLDLPTQTAAKSTKKIELEYEETYETNNQILDSEKQFSLVLTQNFSAAKTHKWYHKKYLSESLRHLIRYTNLDNRIINMFREKELRAPLEIISTFRVEATGLRYFNHLDDNQIFGHIVDICNASNKKEWMSPHKRKKLLKSFSLGRKKCVQKIGKKLLDYKSEYNLLGQINLIKFKKFLGSYFKKSRGYIDLIRLFGEDNVFIHGQFSATTKEGQPFQNYFKSGQFKGLGVIDSFMRQGATVVPITIRN